MKINRKDLFGSLRKFLSERFYLHLDKENQAEVVESMTRSSVFVGENLWTLIFAIIIASVGLNVNSTAVVIGAMLISPLMGPIMGVGLGIGTNDFELVKKGSRNLLIATVIGIATSTLYFYLTPLHDAQSELLARTTPSIWDVFIAFSGGLAGIIAVTSREKGNVIPGVAIATALMPPLCTAGYGIAMGNWYYFFGAIYLYFINSLFICISTYLIVRFLRFNKKQFEDRNTEKKVSRYILISVIITILPSIYLGYGIVEKSIFENNAKKFVKENFTFQNTQVINKSFKYSSKSKEIDLLLIGIELPDSTINTIKKRLNNYKLSGTNLIIRQGLNAKQEIDFSQIKASIMEDVFNQDTLKKAIEKPNKLERVLPNVSEELRILFPLLDSYSLNNVIVIAVDSNKKDTITLFTADVPKKMATSERVRLEKWLKTRMKDAPLKVILNSN